MCLLPDWLMEGHFLNIWENIEPKIREINWQFKVVFNILLIWIISLICHFVFIINSHQSLWKPINSKNDISSSVLQYVSQERLGSSQPDQNRRLQILLPRPPSPPPLFPCASAPSTPNWLVLHSCSWTRKELLVSRHSLQIWHLLCHGWKYEILIYVQ